jgi:hypothetical protein
VKPPHPTIDELLLAEARELPTSRSLPIEWHLANCATCQERLRSHRVTLQGVAGVQTASSPANDAFIIGRVRRRLVKNLEEHDPVTFEPAAPDAAPRGWAWAGIAAVLVALITVVGFVRGAWSGTDPLPAGTLPLPHLTPGATVQVSVADICSGRLAAPPPIGDHVRDEVIRNYRMAHLPTEHYELDYLITPELGGATVAANLWPEPYEGLRWNALVKDHLERLLPRKVCKGEVDLATAQRDIASDWVAAYRKYFGTETPLRDYAVLWSQGDGRTVAQSNTRMFLGPHTRGQFLSTTGAR